MKPVFNTANMLYRNLGQSGLKVSVISLGNMINYKPQNYQIDEQILRICFENGINHIDTAQRYAQGQCEVALGKMIQNIGVERENLVISTKIRTAVNGDINSSNSINKKHVKQSITKSLKRLQMDYVDILYAHIYDETTPLQEVCRSFHQVIEEGKAFYWATSNWNAEAIFQAFAICEKYNLHRPISAQLQYNMLTREQIQSEYQTLITKYNFGLITWSPLAGGFLTGKYLEGIPENEVNRMTEDSYFGKDRIKDLYYDKNYSPKNLKILVELKKIAEEDLKCKLVNLALAWVIKFKHTSSALTGARNSSQLLDSLKSLQILDQITPQLEARINKILNNQPVQRTNFTKWQNFPHLRPKAE